MRKLVIAMMLAGAAAPAFAAPDESGGSNRARAERGDGYERPARAERQFQRIERADRSEERMERAEARARRAEARADVRAEAIGRADRADVERIREARREAIDRADGGEPLRARVGGVAEPNDLRQSSRPVPDVMRPRVPLATDTARPGTPSEVLADRRGRRDSGWSSHWRRDHRYDWRRWRDRHRSLFRLGIYSDPFGWRYRPYQVGWTMYPNYYGSRYWLNDPWRYRLPHAPAGYRWIRYWDDAVLVDTWNGRVVDVIHNFFW